MADNAAYSAARATARACVLASAASAAPLWLFSRLTPYHFLFSAPETLSSFGDLINVCAFTGYLLAAAAIPTFILYFYAIGTGSWPASVFATLAVGSMAVIHFYAGVMGWGPPNAISRSIGALLLVPIAIRWIVPIQRFFRKHSLLFIPVAYSIGISLAVLMAFAFAAPEKMPVRITDQLGHAKSIYIAIKSDHSFYTAKNVLEFGFWDWIAAGAGALGYLGAAIIWRNLLKPSTPAPKPD